MKSLADPKLRAALCERLARLDAYAAPKWGRMSAPQMVCHLNDSFRVGMGEKYASPATSLLQRTVVKFVALYAPIQWPPGVPTRPEIDQAMGGTRPKTWANDRAELLGLIESFAERKTFGEHPIFGKMSPGDWLVWGYRHVDHHLRQFGV